MRLAVSAAIFSIARAAVEQMPLHGRARRFDRVRLDGAQDLLVLALEQLEMGAVRRPAPRSPRPCGAG